MDQIKAAASTLLHHGDNDGNNGETAQPQNHAALMAGKGARLQVSSAPFPVPATSTDLVIRAYAWAVNPVDWKLQDYPFIFPDESDWPVVLGTDVAGVVHAVGPGVEGFKVGDRVISHQFGLATRDPRNGGFQHYTLSHTHTTAIIPATTPFTSAVVLPLALSTAAVGLFSPAAQGFLGLPPPVLNPSPSGKTIVVWGGSSSVGAVTIQLAVASGTKVVAVASAKNHAFVRDLGAEAVLDYKSADVAEAVVAALQKVGGEFAGVYDAISIEESFAHGFEILLKLGGGNLASVQGMPKAAVPSGVKIGPVMATDEVTWPIWKDYVPLALKNGSLKCAPEAFIVGEGLEKVQDGMDLNKKGVSAQKVVIEA